MTAIVITNEVSFDKTVVLSNTAYDIALAIRSAESYGVGSRAAVGVQNIGYGVDFKKGTPTSFTFFADTYPSTPSAANCHGLPATGAGAPDAQPGDCVYTTNSDAMVNKDVIGNYVFVKDFCVRLGATQWSCANSGDESLSSLDIVFSRPYFDTFIHANGKTDIEYTKACLIIASSDAPFSNLHYVSVELTGEITANASASSCS